MIKTLLFLTLIGSLQVFGQEIDLEFFSLSPAEIGSEGSIIYYSNSLPNIVSNEFLAIEGWNYDIDTREYSYFCFIKIDDTIHKLESVSRSKEDSKTKSVFKNNDVTLIVETFFLKELGSESYYVNGKLTVTSGNTRKLYDIIGLVAV